jgi:dihydrofolate reductase
MRKLIVTGIVSLDGYFDGEGGNVWALPMDGFFDAHNLERMRAADTLLFGPRTYLDFKGFWPPIAENPALAPATPHDPARADQQREIAQLCGQTPKVVISDSLTEEETDIWAGTTTLVRRADGHAAVARLKEQDGRDILVFGSRLLWNDLLAAGLVDELHVMMAAIALGAGSPAFTAPVTSLRLFDVERQEGSENVVLRYHV